MMYKSCIFDLDGTLTDTLDSLTFSVNLTMKEMGLPEITRDQCRMFVGNGSRVLLEKALRAASEEALERLEEAMEIYGRVFNENCMYHVAPYEGIVQLLGTLKEQGIRCAVLSNKPDRQAVHVVETVFGKDLFFKVQGQKEGVPRKPDPTAVLQIAGEMGATPEETIYIGGSEVDIRTGHAAGMRTIGVSWGFRSREVLKEANAAYIVDTAQELLELISAWEEKKGR